MTDPYRPPHVRLTRRPAAPVWESFVTWGVAGISILFTLYVWIELSRLSARPPTLTLTDDRSLFTLRVWSLLCLFSLPLPAGIALLTSRPISVALYPGFALGMLVATALIEPLPEALMIDVGALACAGWTFYLWHRGRFRRP